MIHSRENIIDILVLNVDDYDLFNWEEIVKGEAKMVYSSLSDEELLDTAISMNAAEQGDIIKSSGHTPIVIEEMGVFNVYENEQLKATFYEEESALNYKVALEQKIL